MAPWEQLKAAYRHPRDEHTHTHTIFAVPTCLKRSRSSKKFGNPRISVQNLTLFQVTISRNVSPRRTGHHIMFRKSPAGSNWGSQHHSFRNFWGHWISRPHFLGPDWIHGLFPRSPVFWGLVPQKGRNQ